MSEESRMDGSELVSRLAGLQREIFEVSNQIDLTTILWEEVVERTQNFREGFYGLKRIRDLQRTATKVLQVKTEACTDPENMVGVLEGCIQNMRNVQATIMTEIDRLDK